MLSDLGEILKKSDFALEAGVILWLDILIDFV